MIIQQTQEQKALGLIAVNGMDETNFVRASEFLFSESEGQMIIDTYKEQMTSQAIFTSTPSQFEHKEYTLDTSVGLGDQSFTVLPVTKVGESVFGAGKVVGPVVVRQSGQVYDDATLGVINQLNNVAPNITNKYILDTENVLKVYTGIDIVNGALSPEPPVTLPQLIGNRINTWVIEPIVNEFNNE